MKHPCENDLALLAGGETGSIRRFFLERHLRNCENCQDSLAEFSDLRGQLTAADPPDVDWNFLAAEMRANIRLGLEAGACVRGAQESTRWIPRLAVGFASLLVLVGASFFVTNSGLLRHSGNVAEASTPVLQTTGSGIELRKGAESFTFPGHQGVRTDQTVSAQGVIEARYINGDTGSVTINNVYMQQ
jgi:hypothetical protein